MFADFRFKMQALFLIKNVRYSIADTFELSLS